MTIKEQYESLKRQRNYLQGQLRENEADIMELRKSCLHLKAKKELLMEALGMEWLQKKYPHLKFVLAYECPDCGFLLAQKEEDNENTNLR